MALCGTRGGIVVCCNCDTLGGFGVTIALRIDDPVDAIAVHGAGGIVGILAVPVFMEVDH